MLDVRQHRAERAAEFAFGARRKRAVALAVKAFGCRDDRLLRAVVRARELERGFDGFGAAVAKERVFEVTRREHRERFGEHRAQRIEQILAVQRLPVELSLDGAYDFGMAVTDVENPESAQAVDVLSAVDVAVAVRSRVGPLDDRGGAVRRASLCGIRGTPG